MSKPIFRSQADSFLVNPYWPQSGLLVSPVAVYEADEALPAAMASDQPPQAVLFSVNEALEYLSPDGTPLGSLADGLRLAAHRAAILLRYGTLEASRAIVRFAEVNNLMDVTLCVPFSHRMLLPDARASLPLSRGMLDCRGLDVTQDPLLLSEACQRCEATMLLLDHAPSRALADSLRRRFVQFFLAGDPAEAVGCGACGLLTQRPGELYSLLSRLPEPSCARPPMLIAHKGYHNTGEYPENATAGVMAAGRLGFDSAEIDVTLSSDDVLVVQHDQHTGNLYNEKRVVTQTPWSELAALRRKAFPDYGMDRFEDLIACMQDYPETPVMVDIKTPAAEYGVEEVVRQMNDILPRLALRQGCTCLAGMKAPYPAYVHRHLPSVPLAYCTGARDEEPSEDPRENNLRVYRFAIETAGSNSAFNPYQTIMNRAFLRLAHLRGITVYAWTWAFKPWEEDGEAITASYLSGLDGLTSDWVEKFAHVPVELLPALPESHPAGQPLLPLARLLLRDGSTRPAASVSVIPLDAGATVDPNGSILARPGVHRFLLGTKIPLPLNKCLTLLSRPVSVRFGE